MSGTDRSDGGGGSRSGLEGSHSVGRRGGGGEVREETRIFLRNVTVG